jgi:hypothetical protein
VSIEAESTGLLVKPAVARRQLDAEVLPPPRPGGIGGRGGDGTQGGDGGTKVVAPPKVSRRYDGTVQLDPARVGGDAGRIAEKVIAHLAGQLGAEVRVTLEIEALLPNGASDQIVRAVTKNSHTLKFSSHAFESE